MDGVEKRRGASEDRTPGASLQDLLVSGIRISAGLALYGIEQLQNLAASAGSGGGLPAIADQVGITLDSVTDFLASGMDNTKRDALKSVSRVASKAVAKSVEVLSELANAGSGEPAAFPATETTSVYGSPPRLAVDVLTGADSA
jgi:hypothetical protein